MKDSIIRISIILLDVDPAIWRRIEVPATYTLEGLHDVIQILMGWADYHSHHFQFGDVMYGVTAPDDHEMNDGRKVQLWTLVDDGERTFQYLYDYGDGWCCIVVLEAVAPMRSGVSYPRITEGARRGPPEDVGGSWGYSEFLEAIADPKHERHKELLEWSGGDFDPQQFDIDEINRRLPRSHRVRLPAARPQSALPAELAGGPHRTHTVIFRQPPCGCGGEPPPPSVRSLAIWRCRWCLTA